MKGNQHAGASGGKSKLLARAGWIFLLVAILAAVAAILYLVLVKDKGIDILHPAAGTAGGQTQTDAGQADDVPDGNGGKTISISGVLCDFAEPDSVTFGVRRTVDFSGLADALIENARAAGWGTLVSSLSEDGALLVYPETNRVLPGDKYDAQTAFLQSAQPEALARTFVSDAGLYGLLQGYGITLSTDVSNNNGVIGFSGTSDQPQSECRAQLNFLYDGSLNQLKLYAVYLADAVTTEDVTPLKEAVKDAVSWTYAGTEATQVTAAELRSVSGIPLYVLTCADGSVAYALAVKYSTLAQYPEALAVYETMMKGGIQEYVRTEGAGY